MKYYVTIILLMIQLIGCRRQCSREIIYKTVYEERTEAYMDAIIEFPPLESLNIIYYPDSIVVDDSVIYIYPWGKELLKFHCVYECKFGRLNNLASYFEGEWLEIKN